MPKGVKLRKDQEPLYFVGIDGTGAVDTVVWGHVWNSLFRWRNLLWELNKVSGSNRREDTSHSELPVRRLVRNHRRFKGGKVVKTVPFADTVILPHGGDGGGGSKATGLDPLWPGPDASDNDAQIDAACRFMQTFILSPSADKSTSALNDAGQGVTADVVYISSHGTFSGRMTGDVFAAEPIFSPGAIAGVGGRFRGPKWVLLSNCSTLSPFSHDSWLKVMGGATPLRGLVGFQSLCPGPNSSASVFLSFAHRLARGKTLIEAWSETLRKRGLANAWVVLCHEAAKDDTIIRWNAGTLTPIPSASKILFFDEANPTGKEVKPTPPPFEVFWSKAGTRITSANQGAAANKLGQGDRVVITVKPEAPATKFSDGDEIRITLVYIRTDYPQKLDVTKIFEIEGNPGVDAVTTDDLNPSSPGGDDSWKLKVKDDPAEVKLELKCRNDGLVDIKAGNYPFWLRVRSPSGTRHDFVSDGSIIIEK